jgi:D-arabinose 1-dehydrogenase-like Zn-dependent alcohol dehydrogenase
MRSGATTPEPGIEEVLIEVRACGICGSDAYGGKPTGTVILYLD